MLPNFYYRIPLELDSRIIPNFFNVGYFDSEFISQGVIFLLYE